MKIFDVTASRSQGWWAIHANVPGASVWTQARRLDQVEATAREAISLALDTAQDSFELSIEPVVPEGIRHEVELARNTARLAAIAQAIATTLNQHAAVSLTAEGYTVRDAGYLMNLSSQRISQLVAQQRNRAEESTKASTTFESVVESLLAQLLSAADANGEVTYVGQEASDYLVRYSTVTPTRRAFAPGCSATPLPRTV